MSNSLPRQLEFYPFAYTLFTEELETYCWYCIEPCPKKKHCIGCGFAIFCNKTCQSLGWKDHKAECKGFRTAESLPDIEVRLLGRIVLRYKTIQSGKDKEDPDFYTDRTSKRTIMEIWAHVDKMREDEFAKNKFGTIYDELVKFYDPKFLLPKDEIFELHCRNYINRHGIGNFKEIGKGLYLDLCAYDHSCRPNSIYISNGFKTTLRALSPTVNLLDKSTTFYSYIELFCSQQYRKKLLLDTWYFKCECERCEDPKDHYATSILCPLCSKIEPTSVCIWGSESQKDPVTQLITCKKCHEELSQNYVVEAIGTMRYIDRIFNDNELEQMPEKSRVPFLQGVLTNVSAILPHENVYLCKLIQALISLVPPTDNHELLRLHLMAEKCVRDAYPKNHPVLAQHLHNIGVFAGKLGKKDKSLKYLREAQEMLDFVFDEGDPKRAQIRTMIETIESAEIEQKLEKLTVDETEKPRETINEDDEIDDDLPNLVE